MVEVRFLYFIGVVFELEGFCFYGYGWGDVCCLIVVR